MVYHRTIIINFMQNHPITPGSVVAQLKTKWLKNKVDLPGRNICLRSNIPLLLPSFEWGMVKKNWGEVEYFMKKICL